MKGSRENRNRILILDCGHKNALAIVRHLGKSGRYIIDLVAHGKASLAFFSKYGNRKFIISNPREEPSKYVMQILDLLDHERYLAIIPVSYISYRLCSENAGKIRQKTHLSITSHENILLANSKNDTGRLAVKLGIPYPETVTVDEVDDIEKAEITYPCVIKGPFETGNSIVEYAFSKEEMIKKFRKICHEHGFSGPLPIIQRYIKGAGYGFFAYYRKGECRSWFMHRRIREYPYTGGPSTCAESFFDEKILEHGKKILDHLKWDGVAMIEFKKEESSGVYYLMEINAKFWGSLDLALVAGVNFPRMLVDEALGIETGQTLYKEGIKFQWILNGDLFHVLQKPGSFLSIVRDLFVASNDIWLRDPLPNLFQLVYIPVYYYKKWFR
ncbi:MAG: ATP-grasp domain-containing protein [Bacteroidales bacterium]|jgi:predicted ATP-grasp superfamily ATP-dependent carboligase|nr:ATP-grasp domain-containing protein [Bacteroidales bacterium]